MSKKTITSKILEAEKRRNSKENILGKKFSCLQLFSPKNLLAVEFRVIKNLVFIFSGLRWTLAQLLMQKSKLGLSHPLDMLYHVQPWMIVMVLPFAISFEG